MDIQDYIKFEEDLITEYVKVYPYPEYDNILQKIENNIELYAEYGEQNHICCKLIYENPNNKDLIVKIGKKIYESGGLQALLMNHNIIKYFSPYRQSTNNIIKGQGRIIEEYFQEVCDDWKA